VFKTFKNRRSHVTSKTDQSVNGSEKVAKRRQSSFSGKSPRTAHAKPRHSAPPRTSRRRAVTVVYPPITTSLKTNELENFLSASRIMSGDLNRQCESPLGLCLTTTSLRGVCGTKAQPRFNLSSRFFRRYRVSARRLIMRWIRTYRSWPVSNSKRASTDQAINHFLEWWRRNWSGVTSRVNDRRT